MSRIDEICERCEAATPGPWQQDEYANMVWAINPYGKGMMHLADIRGWGHLTGAGACAFDDAKGFAIQAANAAFIAHARDDIPYLLSEVDRLQSEVEREKRMAEEAEDLAKEADETLKKVQVLLEDAIKEAELMTGLVDPETKGGPDKKYLVVMKYASILEDEGLIPPEELSILWEAAEALRRKEADSDDH